MSEDEHLRSDPALEALGARIAKGRQAAGLAPAEKGVPNSRAAAQGLRAGIEFMVSTVVGGGLGYGLGSWLGHPIPGVVIGTGFGFAAGLRAVNRAMAVAGSELVDEGKRADGRTAD